MNAEIATMQINSQATRSLADRYCCAASTATGVRWYAVMALALHLMLSSGSVARGQQLDLWQTHMTAAAKADSAGHFETEAVLLARALDIAQTHPARHLRPMLTTLSRLTLMLTYVELNREALWKAIASGGNFRLDVGNLDPSMKAFIPTARTLGNAYNDRWRSVQNRIAQNKSSVEQNKKINFEQGARRYGAEHLFRIEVAFRKKLMPTDDSGLAEAEALLAMVVARRDAKDSQPHFREAIESFEKVQKRRSKIDAVSRRFSVADANAGTPNDDIGTGMTSTQFYAMTLAMRSILVVGEESLDKKDLKSFESAMNSAGDLSEEMVRATSRIRTSWPRLPTFGQIAQYRGWMFSTQYKGTKIDPKLFPDSFVQGKAAFQEALSIYGHNYGPMSENVKAVARDYVALLRSADREQEALQIEKRYLKP